jgi:MFS family permease
MSYVHLTLSYNRILIAGFILCFFSGFGQTFFISVFAPNFLEALSLSQSNFGLMYASATLASGLLLPWIGSLLDRVDSIRYTLVALFFFALSCFAIASMESVFVLVLGIFGVRICGQGLFSHISATVIARGFSKFRGRALSLCSLGHPVSEAILPLLAVFITSLVGWRLAWASFGGMLILICLPLVLYHLRGKTEIAHDGQRTAHATTSKGYFRHIPDFIRSWKFWFLVMGSVLPGAILTGVFLYHGVIANDRGWSMAWMASGFAWFAASQVLSSLIGGNLLDRFGAKRLFRVHLLPLASGLTLLALPDSSLWIVPGYLSLAGITSGIGSPVRTALWAEIYGTSQIAKIRSWVGALAVTGTAIGPASLGLFLDAGFSIRAFLIGATTIILTYTLLHLTFAKRLTQ